MNSKPAPEKKNNRKEYQQGLIVSLLIVISGTVLEWITGGHGVSLPGWPVNLQLGIGFILLLLFLHFYYRKTTVIKWFSRVPAAMTSIILFTLLVLILGLSQQNQADASEISRLTGLDHIRNSYTFILSGLYLLTCLGLVGLRRLTPFTFKNIGFALNHVGLWIIVFAGSLGAGDLERLSIYVEEGQSVNYAYNAEHQAREVPFSVELLDFDIKDYPPKLVLINQSDMQIPEDVKNNFPLIEENMQIRLAGWDITVKEFLPSAKKVDNGFEATSDLYNFPAALIEATSTTRKETVTGWMSSGNFMYQPTLVLLGNSYALAMTVPDPKEFSSKIVVYKTNEIPDTIQLKVNEPVHVGAWNLYQISYDTDRGKWSTLSVIEAIRDPWIGFIYTGIFMVLLGAVYLFWIGRNPKN